MRLYVTNFLRQINKVEFAEHLVQGYQLKKSECQVNKKSTKEFES